MTKPDLAEKFGKLTESKPGPMTSRLPSLFARKNAALIAAVANTRPAERP